MRTRVPYLLVLTVMAAWAGCHLDKTGLGESATTPIGSGGAPGAGGAAGQTIITTGVGGGGGTTTPVDADVVEASSTGGAGGGGGSGGAGGSDVEAGAPMSDAGPPDGPTPDAGRSCGSGNMGTCPATQFCERTNGACGGPGVCIPVPPLGTCPTRLSPVCGCDDHDYFNDCFRQQARVSKQKNGNC